MAVAVELVTRSLEECEQVIERGLTTFVEVGQALMEIRDGRLYREQGHPTFEDYCQQRWHWTRKVGYEYIRAAEVAANVTSTLQSPISLTQAVQLAPLPISEQQEIARTVDFSTVSTRELKAIIRERKEEQRAERLELKQAIPPDLPAATDRYRLHLCDLADAPIAPGSIDCIITDPPYPREYLPVYDTLARKAVGWLKPGGSLLVMVGQSYLPEILALMTPHIRYHWTLAYLTPGATLQLWQRKAMTGWKPILWFVNGEYVGDWIWDVCKSDAPDKEHHDWGQSESGMADLVERFTYPGQTVLDPFMGAGTTGVVSTRMNRLFVGVDVDGAAFETTKQRLRDVS